jgi:hypothetical protein
VNGLRGGGNRDLTKVKIFDGSGLMIEDLLQTFGDDMVDLQSLSLWLRSEVAQYLRPATPAFSRRCYDACAGFQLGGGRYELVRQVSWMPAARLDV